jgi:hypothetical protein
MDLSLEPVRAVLDAKIAIKQQLKASAIQEMGSHLVFGGCKPMSYSSLKGPAGRHIGGANPH